MSYYLYNYSGKSVIDTLLLKPNYLPYKNTLTKNDKVVICIYLPPRILAGYLSGIEKLINKNIIEIFDKHNSIIFFFNTWETRPVMKSQLFNIKKISNLLKCNINRIIICTPEFSKKNEIINNHLSYDIKYLAILDLSYKPVEQNIKKNHSIIFMNRRPNNERFQTAKYLYNNYKNRILLSFLCKYGRSDDEFNKKLPLELDPSKSVMAGNAWAGIETIRKFLNDAYVMLIFETNWVKEHCQISEKTYKPILAGIPFIIWGNKPGILSHLRSLGFRTFEPYIDESYDLDINNRYDMLLKTLDTLCLASNKELQNMYINCLPIINHNLNVLKLKNIPDLFENINF